MPSIKSSFEIYKVGIMIEKGEVLNIPKSNKNTLIEDTLFYYLIYDSFQYYKLFGFMFSDIRILIENYLISKPLIFWRELTKELVRLNILTKRESKNFYKNLINENNLLLDKRINKPCNLLKYYFNENEIEIERASTIILPLKPMIPIKNITLKTELRKQTLFKEHFLTPKSIS